MAYRLLPSWKQLQKPQRIQILTEYFQCRFEQEQPDGKKILVAWVEKRGSKVGSLVELKGEDGLWLVISNGGSGQSDEWLRTKQGVDRRSLKSIVH